MRNQFFLVMQLAGLATAWLPRDKNYFHNPLVNIKDPFVATNSENHNITKTPTYDGSVTGADMGGYRKPNGKLRRQIYSQEIRGVNLGAMFIIEPWMAGNEWSTMGCGSASSEFDCVSALGQTQANAVWKQHWARWITDSDLAAMQSYGLNTIRIPLGYWIYEDIVYKDSEHFPQGGLAYLDQLVGWASARNMYIILDLHGAPGAQVASNSFTGQNAPSAGFYVDYQYDRALSWLKWITNRVHTNNNYRGVGMIEVLNEPESGHSTLVNSYYPQAMAAIRGVESSLGIGQADELHVQFMDKRWGAGDPDAAMSGDTLYNAAYDNHRYLKWDTSVTKTQAGYLSASCNDDVSGNWPLIVGEWSLSPALENDAAFTQDQTAFYKKWFAAQVMSYEKQDGWIFWSWKTDLNDYRWDYQKAVKAGVVPTNPSDVYNMGACNGY